MYARVMSHKVRNSAHLRDGSRGLFRSFARVSEEVSVFSENLQNEPPESVLSQFQKYLKEVSREAGAEPAEAGNLHGCGAADIGTHGDFGELMSCCNGAAAVIFDSTSPMDRQDRANGMPSGKNVQGTYNLSLVPLLYAFSGRRQESPKVAHKKPHDTVVS